MLLPREILAGIADGAVTLAFRRWRRPTVAAGGTLESAIGLLAIDAVDPVAPEAIDDAAAARAGYPSGEALRRDLDRRPEGTLYRIALRLAGPDPRIALRETVPLAAGDVAALAARLDRLDRTAPWTRRVLALIALEPGRRAAELAAGLGMETAAFKRDVRKLKALGLTESLETGYRLSPRGMALLTAEREGR